LRVQEINGDFEIRYREPKNSKKKFKKRFRWLKFILTLILLATTLVLLALSPLFSINRIEVVGSQHYNSQDIIASTNLVPGYNGFKAIANDPAHIFLLRYDRAEKNILKNYSYIKKAVVRYILPNRIRIEITEREPFGFVAFLGTNLLIDNEGYVLEAVNNAGNLNFPDIKGLKFEHYEIGQVLQVENSECLSTAVNILETVREGDEVDNFKVYNLVDSVDVSDLKKVNIVLDSRVKVILGNTQDLSYKLNYLKQIFIKGIKKDEKGVLDFSSGDNPSFIPEK